VAGVEPLARGRGLHLSLAIGDKRALVRFGLDLAGLLLIGPVLTG
jgi:hypothetical protein